MSKLPATIGDAADISGRVQSYFEQLEHERTDLRRELDLLQTQNRDFDKQLVIAERRAEKAEQERDQARAQRDDALAKLVALTTLWTTIKNTVSQGESLVTQTAGSIRQSLTGVPSRNGGDKPPGRMGPRPLDEIETGIAKIASAFNEPLKPNEP
jgi:chromosome segregation ATPase